VLLASTTNSPDRVDADLAEVRKEMEKHLKELGFVGELV